MNSKIKVKAFNYYCTFLEGYKVLIDQQNVQMSKCANMMQRKKKDKSIGKKGLIVPSCSAPDSDNSFSC